MGPSVRKQTGASRHWRLPRPQAPTAAVSAQLSLMTIPSLPQCRRLPREQVYSHRHNQHKPTNRVSQGRDESTCANNIRRDREMSQEFTRLATSVASAVAQEWPESNFLGLRSRELRATNLVAASAG
jgi:hypothetical protein